MMNYAEIEAAPEVAQYKPIYEGEGLDWADALNAGITAATAGAGAKPMQIVIIKTAQYLERELLRWMAKKSKTPAKSKFGRFLRFFYSLFK